MNHSAAGSPALPIDEQLRSPRSRPEDQQLLRGALVDLAEQTRFPLVLGGFANDDHVVVSQLIGNTRQTLRGLTVHAGSGLGGRVLLEARPRLVTNYRDSRMITHDYDRPVLAEGVTVFFAVPVVVGAAVRAVLWGGLRTALAESSVELPRVVAIAQRFATNLAKAPGPALGADISHPPDLVTPSALAELEELRQVYAELRAISASVSNPTLRARLEAVERRIITITSGSSRESGALTIDPGLTSREVDVLSLAALGFSNATVGRSLGLTQATVKSYMNTAMRKLGATTRLEAVTMARRRGLLP